MSGEKNRESRMQLPTVRVRKPCGQPFAFLAACVASILLPVMCLAQSGGQSQQSRLHHNISTSPESPTSHHSGHTFVGSSELSSSGTNVSIPGGTAASWDDPGIITPDPGSEEIGEIPPETRSNIPPLTHVICQPSNPTCHLVGATSPQAGSISQQTGAAQNNATSPEQ